MTNHILSRARSAGLSPLATRIAVTLGGIEGGERAQAFIREAEQEGMLYALQSLGGPGLSVSPASWTLASEELTRRL